VLQVDAEPIHAFATANGSDIDAGVLPLHLREHINFGNFSMSVSHYPPSVGSATSLDPCRFYRLISRHVARFTVIVCDEGNPFAPG
jgi:hypothetical protein